MMMRQHFHLYGLVMIIAVLTFALGVRLGRHHPYPVDAYGFHLFHQEPGMRDWLDRHV